MLPMKPPTAEEALMGQISSGLATIKEQVEANDTEKYEAMAETLLENYTPLQLVSAYLKAVSPDDASAVPVKITPERPLPRRGRNNHGHGNNRGGYKGGYKGKRRDGGYQGNRDGKRSYDKKRNFGDKRKTLSVISKSVRVNNHQYVNRPVIHANQ
ncbi:ATP-dependent RNA helicase [Lacticaseibacillus rhamnosus MTCC 5462]|nr:ATP-dependent RNA helicase [Lacticaseibacillus rhamnosus MTCC 5462]